MPKIFKAVNVTMDSNKVNIGIVDPLTFTRKKDVDKDILKNNTENDFFDEVETIESQENKNTEDKKQTNDKVSEAIIQKAKEKAEEIIAKAQKESEKIKLDLEKETKSHLKMLEKESEEKGYEKGYSNGVLEVENLKKEALESLESVNNEKNMLLEQLEPQIVDLIVNILNKLLYKSVEINQGVVVNLIKQGLNESDLSGDIKIKISQADYDIVMKNKEEIVSMINGNTNVEIVKDLSLNKSDCVIETSTGNIDCSLDEQFKTLKENLFFILGNR